MSVKSEALITRAQRATTQVRLRKMETHTRQEQDAVLETYRQALGLA